MKVLLLLFLVGCATAFVVQNKLDNAVEQEEFLLELERAEAEAKTELGKRLQKIFDGLLEKIKEEAEKGKVVKEELIEKLKEVREKLKELKMDIGHKARELIEKLKEKSDDFWNYILGKKETHEVQAMDFNFRDLMNKLKDSLLSKIDKEKLKERIEALFGKGSEMADSLLKLVNEKGDKYKEKLLDMIDRYLGKKETKRSIKEFWEKIKEYFQNLHIDLKEKYIKFGEWVKEHVKTGIDTGKSKLENIKTIAKEILDHTKGVSKEVADEALEFFRPYKDDLGALWKQLKEALNDISQKKD